MHEVKRLTDFKAEKEKSKKKLRRVMTPEQLRAQEEELAAIEAKRVKMMDEFNHCTNFRDDYLPITKVELLIDAITIDLGCFDNNPNFAKDSFKEYFEGLWNIYFVKYGNPNPSTSSASLSRSNSGNLMLGLLQRLGENSNKPAKNDHLVNNEYERYVTTDFVSHIPTEQFASLDVLGFWKAKESQFPILSRMARDVLSVQATSVASEYAFSISGRVLSNKRTRLTPVSLEMCMCLKDYLNVNE
ncbi:zinc finger BED domain-containing protein RICESLEEPER 2 [Tanacetum coccineum]